MIYANKPLYYLSLGHISNRKITLLHTRHDVHELTVEANTLHRCGVEELLLDLSDSLLDPLSSEGEGHLEEHALIFVEEHAAAWYGRHWRLWCSWTLVQKCRR